MTEGQWFAAGAVIAVVGSLVAAGIGAAVTLTVERKRRTADSTRRWDAAKREAFAAMLAAADALTAAVFDLVREDGSVAEMVTPLQRKLGSTVAALDLIAGAPVRQAVKDWGNVQLTFLAQALKVLKEHTDPMVRVMDLVQWTAAELGPRRQVVLEAMRAELTSHEAPSDT